MVLAEIVIEIFKNEMKIFLANFFNKVFQTTYPDIWREQLLRPEIKKGHTELKPKLRGITITQLLPSIYDCLIDSRLKQWIELNPEQASWFPAQARLPNPNYGNIHALGIIKA